MKIELEKYKILVEKELNDILGVKDLPQNHIFEAMRYSLLASGKRLRPILAIKACELVGGDLSQILKFACSIEMIHTYSLIHDDLPSLDNDDYRRGKLTNHKVYGESMAILAGDGLLNLAYELISEEMLKNKNNCYKYAKAFNELSVSAGIYGMIGGQVVDVLSENQIIDKDILEFIHNKKTSALIEASLVCGAIIGGGSNSEIENIRKFGKAIGLCFQIRDDILDIVGDMDKLGKDIGSDEENSKCTYVSMYGLEKSIEMTQKLCNEAKNSINNFKSNEADFFKDLAHYLVYREK